jgi:hypothetical protein
MQHLLKQAEYYNELKEAKAILEFPEDYDESTLNKIKERIKELESLLVVSVIAEEYDLDWGWTYIIVKENDKYFRITGEIQNSHEHFDGCPDETYGKTKWDEDIVEVIPEQISQTIWIPKDYKDDDSTNR